FRSSGDHDERKYDEGGDEACDQVAIPEQPTLEEGMRGRQGVHQEHIEENAGKDHLGNDLGGIEPAETVAAVESELRQADGKREHHEPFQIEDAILGLSATRQ